MLEHRWMNKRKLSKLKAIIQTPYYWALNPNVLYWFCNVWKITNLDCFPFYKIGIMFIPTSYNYVNNKMFPYSPTHVHDHIWASCSCLEHSKCFSYIDNLIILYHKLLQEADKNLVHFPGICMHIFASSLKAFMSF